MLMIALTAILMLGVLAPLVLAEDTSNTTDANTTANLISAADNSGVSDSEANLNVSEDVNGMGLFMKKVGLWFTFNKEKKAEKELELAKIQLIKAKIAEMNNNSDAMEKALNAHEKLIADVEKTTNELKNDTKNSGKLTGLDRAIEVHNAQINKLNALLANTNLTEDQKIKLEARLAHVENVTAKLSGLNARIEAKISELKNESAAKLAELKTEANAKNMTVEELILARAKEAKNASKD